MAPIKSNIEIVYRDSKAIPYPGLEQRLVLATRSPHQPEQVRGCQLIKGGGAH